MKGLTERHEAGASTFITSKIGGVCYSPDIPGADSSGYYSADRDLARWRSRV